MKRKIDINKINCLLKESESTPKQLADFINYPVTNLALALGKKHNRNLPMDYLISVADFFKVQPKDITICTNENITSIEDKNQLQKEN